MKKYKKQEVIEILERSVKRRLQRMADMRRNHHGVVYRTVDYIQLQASADALEYAYSLLTGKFVDWDYEEEQQ